MNGVQVAAYKGAKMIIATDMKEDALKLAKEKGATEAIKADQVEDYVKRNDISVDLVVDCVGSQKSFDLATKCVMSGGRIVS